MKKDYEGYTASELLEEIEDLRKNREIAKAEGNSYWDDCLYEDLFQAKSALDDRFEAIGWRFRW